jgi:hypothetical protein
MHPAFGEFALAAADRGMGGFQHGVCPPYVYQAYSTVLPAIVNCGCGLGRPAKRRRSADARRWTQMGENRGTADGAVFPSPWMGEGGRRRRPGEGDAAAPRPPHPRPLSHGGRGEPENAGTAPAAAVCRIPNP